MDTSLDYLDTFESDGNLYASTTPLNHGDKRSPLARIRKCDLLTFIAIAQSVEVTFVDIAWHQGLGSAGDGATASVQQSLSGASTSLAFKQITYGHDENYMYKIMLAEILVLQHPPIRAAENIIDLHGVGWNVQGAEHTGEDRLIPVLVYENATRYGNLHAFMRKIRPTIHTVTGEDPRLDAVHYSARLKLCIDIGKAIQTMHSCNVIHGDLKPENVLVFPGQDGGGYAPKVIDFGYSTYGFGDDDLVRLPRTPAWAAPEWHHREFRIKDAKKADIYSFSKICEWILDDHIDCAYAKKALWPHLRQFYQLGLCKDPQERTDNVSFLVSILSRALQVERGSFFHDILNLDPFIVERHMKKTYGEELAVWHINDITGGVQKHSSEIKHLSTENELGSQSDNAFFPLLKDLPQIPNIAKNFLDFQDVHFLVRVRIQKRLAEILTEEIRSSDVREKAALQLALCYELAFGVERDINKSQQWLLVSGQDVIQLSDALDEIHKNNLTEGSKIKAMIRDSNTFAFTYRYMVDGKLDHALAVHSVESQGKFASLGPHAFATLSSRMSVAMLLEAKGRHDEAMDLLRQMLDTTENEWGPHGDWPCTLRLNMSMILANQGDYVRAISMGEQLLQIDNGPEFYVETLEYVSMYYGKVCDYQRSAQYSRYAWEMRKNDLGENHPVTLNALELLSYAMTDVDMDEAETLQTRVLEWRSKVMGKRNHVLIQTMQNLAFVRAFVKGKEMEAISMQQDVLSRQAESVASTWPEIVFSTNRLAVFQERLDQFDEAIETRSRLLIRRDDLLSCPEGLALLGNHARNLKRAGRDIEAESMKTDVLQRISTILKPESFISNDTIRGVAHAFLDNGKFDDEAAALYVKTFKLWERRRAHLGEQHGSTALVNRFLKKLYNEGHLVQSSIHMLGLEHTTTKLAVQRLKNSLADLVTGDVENDAYISEAMSWIKSRLASLVVDSEEA